MSEKRRYRKFSAQQKTELVLASLRGPKTITELCREHDISDSLLRKWREQFLAGAPSACRAGRIAHRRGGYRDPESRAFIESWFSKLKQRCIWREEFETLDESRAAIGAYVDRYHHRPHSRLAYRTPHEVAATWKDHDDQLTPAT